MTTPISVFSKLKQTILIALMAIMIVPVLASIPLNFTKDIAKTMPVILKGGVEVIQPYAGAPTTINVDRVNNFTVKVVNMLTGDIVFEKHYQGPTVTETIQDLPKGNYRVIVISFTCDINEGGQIQY